MPDPILLLAAGIALGVLALLAWRVSVRREGAQMLRGIAADPDQTVYVHAEFPPVDLSRPILGEAAWRAIRTHAGDAAYLAAVEAVHGRFLSPAHPMALSDTLRETMAEFGLGFREAMLRLAHDGAGAAAEEPGRRGPIVIDGEAAPG